MAYYIVIFEDYANGEYNDDGDRISRDIICGVFSSHSLAERYIKNNIDHIHKSEYFGIQTHIVDKGLKM